MVGGATTFEGVYSYFPTGIDIKPSFTRLKRKLGDYLNYSLPPSCYNTDLPSVGHSVLLPIGKLDHLMYYPSLFSHNGYGYRYLNTAELSLIFGLSQTIDGDTPHAAWSQIVPVKILDTLLKPLLVLEQDTLSPQIRNDIPPIYEEKGFTLLPHINRELDHGWFEHVDISKAAAKSDDAAINNAVWNQRVTLIFPLVQHSHLHSLRGGLMQYFFHKLYA